VFRERNKLVVTIKRAGYVVDRLRDHTYRSDFYGVFPAPMERVHEQ